MQQELAKRRSEIINKINELFNYPTGMPAYTFSYLNVSGPGQVLAQIMAPSGTPIGTQEYNWKELRFYAPSATTDQLKSANAVYETVWGKIKELQSYRNFKLTKQQDANAETLGWIKNPYSGEIYYLQLTK